ncbi:DUF6268 family outer membrane beta-barrel protein [Chitinophaga japonensis]|uniref:DUF6268 domain-containing protein n=1 Tax=Chitinophaga japonensis TaxID=104662 RepID=A0A562TF81_CHIJA|nr:DUF6268 family outer membrane beta-barrel protein [Chitinophaga japonensis]TWI92145.1 hypothetical protein LX66_1528 [Chitinophaga japonensis]
MKQLFCLLSGLMIPYCSYAQDKELLHISWQYAPFRYQDTAMHTQSLQLRAGFPLYHKGRHLLAGTVSYRNIYFHGLGKELDMPLHGVGLGLAWLYRVDEKHSLSMFSQTGVFSDMKDLSGEDMRIGLGFRYSARHSERLRYGFGLAYARQFFGNQVVPFLEIDYRFTERLRLYGQIPVRPRLEYTLSSRAKMGAGLQMDVSSYRLSASADASGWIKTTQWAMQGYYQHRLSGRWQVQGSAGLIFRQQFERYADDSPHNWTLFSIPLGDRPAAVQSVQQRGLLLQISLLYSLPE